MQFSTEEINKSLKSISFTLIDADKELIIRSRFNILNKSIFGSSLLLVGGVFMTYILIIKTLRLENFNEFSDIIPLIVFGILSLTLFIAGTLGIYSSSTDFIKINKSCLEFKSLGIKSTKIKLSTNFRIIKKSRVEKIKSSGPTSHFIIIELYVDEKGDRRRILSFHMDEKESSKAHELGNQLKFIISQKKNNYLQQNLNCIKTQLS